LIGAGAILATLGSGWLIVPMGPGAFAQNAAIEASEPAATAQTIALEPDEGRLMLDIELRPEPTPSEILAYQACAIEQDAARLRGEIIVCQQLDGGSAVSGFDKAKWERGYAQRTQGVKTPNVAGAGGTIMLPGEGSLIAITVTSKFGDPPPPALFIDVEALPHAAPGSDADRIAHGLAPKRSD